MLTLRTADLPAAERFDYWMSQLSAFMPAEIRTPRRDNFLATTSGEDLGTMRAIVSTYPTFKARRTPAMIRYADPECYVFVLARTGWLSVTQGRQTVTLGPGEATVYSTSAPFQSDSWSDPSTRIASSVMAMMPRSRLPTPLSTRDMDRLIGTGIPATSGLAAVATSCLQSIAEYTGGWRPSEVMSLSTAAADLVVATLAEALQTDQRLPPATNRSVLLARVQAYIKEHINDPALSAAGIADAHHISTRLLYRIFAERGLTVNGWLRATRLQGSGKDLVRFPHLPVVTIAHRWGFSNPAQFAKAFHKAMGTTPTAYRRDSLRAESESRS